ncbi:ECF transporter S component [uncultured Limosilactobacillus sp.]|uniref:ECF transporter S component n=1 Tax=uncultured Limosilactobacillus sp. TaxID=2837629 RepID=UPI0025F8B49A|nr:ECF transporter S component [uncultured Limosilactobacillus sp.]
MNHQRQQIHQMTRRTLLIVLVIIQDLLPLIGNLPIGPLSITTLPITVAVVAILFGPFDGAIIGSAWGILTWGRALVYPSSPLAPLIFTNPVIAVLPRIMVGIVAGYAFKLYRRKNARAAAVVAGVLASLTNSLLVLGGIYLFANTPAVAAGYHVQPGNLLNALTVILATNGVVELIITAIVTPLIALPLLKHLQRKG